MPRYFLDLFAGIGGFALGAYRAGLRFDGHYFSEIDDYAIKVYKKRFPDAFALGSIIDIRGGELPSGSWTIAGGFPCQDLSVAGKGAGLDGSRSGLWFEYARLIGELRPEYAVMENVGALAIRGLDRVLGSLAEIGYDAEWQDIRASDVGAPHRRERIWIVAYPGHGSGRDIGAPEGREGLPGERAADTGETLRSGGEPENVADPDSSLCDGGPNLPGREEKGRTASCWSGENVSDPEIRGLTKLRGSPGESGYADLFCEALADSEGTRSRGLHSGSRSERTGEANAYRIGENVADSEGIGVEGDGPAGIEKPRIPSGEGLLGCDGSGSGGGYGPAQSRLGECAYGVSAWLDGSWERGIPRVATAIPDRVNRLKCLGNSIVPQIAEMIFRQIRSDYDNRKDDRA
jgi:DNA (cytosine-5)-methyltransferase 1